MLYDQGQPVNTQEQLEAFKKKHLHYDGFYPNDSDQNKIISYNCHYLNAENLCDNYQNRPSLCRNYPASYF